MAKKYPMTDAILSALHSTMAYLVEQNDYKEAEKIQQTINRYIDDMTGLLQTDPDSITNALSDYLEDTTRVLAGTAPANPWHATFTRELNAIIAAQAYVQDAVAEVTQHKRYPMTTSIIEALDAEFLRLRDAEEFDASERVRHMQEYYGDDMAELLRTEPDIVTGALKHYREDMIARICEGVASEVHYNASQQWIAGVAASEAYVRQAIEAINGAA